jgi:hypothetical protein
VIVTITGGQHLQEFASFSLKAVRAFDPSKPGARCLRGPFLRVDGERVPPMNTASEYILPASAAAFYLYGRSARGAAHDVHLPLVHEPGAQVTRPLSFATDAKRADVARLACLLEQAPYVFASTAALTNPHFYTRRKDWSSDADFEFAVRGCRLYGHREGYVPPEATKIAYSETVFHSGAHFYWSGWQPPAITGWINRKPLPRAATAAVVDQSLRVENARLLAVPELPDAWQGLPREVTSSPFFRFGVATFGYEAIDLRPRLLRRRRR